MRKVAPATLLNWKDEFFNRSVLGPPVALYIEKCWSPQYQVLWCLAIFFLACTLAITMQHLCSLWRAPASFQRTYYMRIAAFPACLATLSTLSVLIPRSHLLSTLLRVQCEASALSNFGMLLFMFLSEYAYGKGNGKDLDADGGAGAGRLLEGLNEQGPKIHFGTLPICCFFRLCVKPHFLRPLHFVLLHYLLMQYIYVAPSTAIIYLWAALSLPLRYFHLVRKIMLVLQKVSSMLALYSIIVLSNSTLCVLKPWHTNLKFWSFKFIILVLNVQDMLISWLIGLANEKVSCVDEAAGAERGFHFASRFWFSWATIVECLICALVMLKAFPASEVLHQSRAAQTIGVELDLERLCQKSEQNF